MGKDTKGKKIMEFHYEKLDAKRLYTNEQWLRKQYWWHDNSIGVIAEFCDVNDETIRKWFIKLGIPRRTKGEALRIRWKNPDYRGFQTTLQRGRKHTEKTKRKIATANRGRINPKMEESPRWGGTGVTDNAFRKRARKTWERYYNATLLPCVSVHHIDGNPRNNDLINLEVLTESQHRRKHGLLSQEI